MGSFLERAFREAEELTPAERDLLAWRLLAELAADDDFDGTMSATCDRLATCAGQALAEHQAGLTAELDPERLAIP